LIRNEPMTPSENEIELSVVIPAFNEEQVLPLLFNTLVAELDGWVKGHWEVVFVDDGSSDKTVQLIHEQNGLDPRFKAVILSRNFGHQPAVSCGVAYAQGRFVGIIDADLQDPLPILQQLYRACSVHGANVAFGVRQRRDASVLLKLTYKSFYRFMNRFSEHPWPVDAGDFCVMDRTAVNAVLALPETGRILRGLRSWVGLHQVAIEYERPRRQAGNSKYNLFRLSRLAIDSIVNFSSAPLLLAVWSGLSMSVLCAIIIVFFLINRLYPSFSILGYSTGASPGTATIVTLVSLLFAINFFCLGIIGQYLAIVLKEVKRRPQAVVQQVVGQLKRRSAAYPVGEDET
jgi:glycosyltransferase involved in cell wall biosynthesis